MKTDRSTTPSLAHVPHLPPRLRRDDSMGMPQADCRYTVEEVLQFVARFQDEIGPLPAHQRGAIYSTSQSGADRPPLSTSV